ncbi:MAG: hypothetical protein CM1200mP22_33010 [Dehalococcoidia bacterium]|nr:MAG: hypothetical protein CM1200mP22_33010 [Dehalococcoidia bacterium]
MTKMASIVGPGGTQEDHDYYLDTSLIISMLHGVIPQSPIVQQIWGGCFGDDPLDPPMRDTLKVNGDKATITVTSSLQALQVII